MFWWMVLFFFLLTGCGRDPFPFCCDQEGTGDLPIVRTYDHGFRTGFGRLFPPLSNLIITSASDLANFQAAANLRSDLGSGTITGIVIDPSGVLLEGATLASFDDAGNPLGLLFYNGLGGVPDFSNTVSTSETGSFTVFNVPPGPFFLKVIQGGRGNGRVFSFPDSVSQTIVEAFPSTPESIDITGTLADADTNQGVGGARIIALGMPGLLATSGVGGGVNIPEVRRDTVEGFGPSLPSNAGFIIKVTAPGFLDTYQFLDTDPDDIQAGATDLTRFLKIQSEEGLRSAGVDPPVTSTTGVLAGIIRELDRTPRRQTQIEVRDVNGNLVGDLFFSTSNNDPAEGRVLVRAQPDGGLSQTSGNGEFVVFNLPPGKVYLTAVSTRPTLVVDNPDKFSVSLEIPIFSGGAFYIDELTVFRNSTLEGTVRPSHSQTVKGRVRDLKRSSVDNITISVLGFSGVLAKSGDNGRYILPRYSHFNPVDNGGQCSDQHPELSDGCDQAKVNYFPFDPAPSFSAERSRFSPYRQPCDISYIGFTPGDPTRPPACALITSGTHVLRLSSSSTDFFETFQEIQLDNNPVENIRDLTILRKNDLVGVVPSEGTGIVVGTIRSLTSGRTLSGVSIRVTDEEGIPVGTIRYVNDDDQLNEESGQSFNNGRFLVTNIPIPDGQGDRLVFLKVTSRDDSGERPVRVFPNAASVIDFVVNKSPALTTEVNGTVKNLKGTQIGNASGRAFGEKTTFSSNNDGSYSLSLQSFGDYILRLEEGSHMASENYQVTTPIGAAINETLYMTSLGELFDLSGGRILQDSNLGVIAGEMVTTRLVPFSLTDFSDIFLPVFTELSSRGVVSGFFNSDDKRDVAIVGKVGGGGKVHILNGSGEGSFQPVLFPLVDETGDPVVTLTPVGTNLVAVAAADFNGDGLTDLAAVDNGANPGCNRGEDCTGVPNRAAGIFVLLSNGNETFTAVEEPISIEGTTLPSTLEGGGVDLVAVDIDIDGRRDIIVLNESGSVFILLGLGNGTFGLNLGTARTLTGATGAGRIVAGRWNLDIFVDLIVSNTATDKITIYINGSSETTIFDTDPGPTEIALGDVNLDGAVDLAVLTGGTDPSINIFLNSPQPFRMRIPLGGIGAPPQNLFSSDYDGDGRLDYLVTFPGIGKGGIFFGDGAGHFSSPNMFDLCETTCTGMLAATQGFINLDGRVDLVSVSDTRFSLSLGALTPLEGIQAAATSFEGAPVGEITYFGSSDTLDIGLSRTTSNNQALSRFLIYNVPPGITMVRAVSGGSGNAYVDVKPGVLTYLSVQAVQSPPETIISSGQVGDFVGNPITDVTIQFLGTGVNTLSDENSAYEAMIRAQSRYIVLMDRPVEEP